MLLRLNAAFAAMANKLDHGIVAYNFGDRQFSRNYVVPQNPNTSNQSSARAAFSAASVAYSALSPTDVADWAAVAALMPSRIDSLGRPYPWTARSLFQSVTGYDNLFGTPGANSPPIDYTAFAVSLTVSSVAAGNLTITVVVPVGGGPASNALVQLRITPPVNSTAAVAKRTDLRLPLALPSSDNFIDTSVALTGTAVIPVADIAANMGFTPATGQVLGIELTPLTEDHVSGPSTFLTRVTLT